MGEINQEQEIKEDLQRKKLKLLAWFSLVFFLLANVLFYGGGIFFQKHYGRLLEIVSFRLFNPELRTNFGWLSAATALMLSLGAVFYILRYFAQRKVRKFKRLKIIFIVNTVFAVSSLNLLPAASWGVNFLFLKIQPYAIVPISSPSEPFISREGYTLKIPKGFTSVDNPEGTGKTEAMPYNAMLFYPEVLNYSLKKYEPFCVMIGVHKNENKLTVSEFKEWKDKFGEVRPDKWIINGKDAALSGIEAIEDHLLIKSEQGKRYYVRKTLVHGDKVFTFVGVLGRTSIIPQYKELFDSIEATFAFVD